MPPSDPQQLRCPSCQAQLNPGARYCHSCGVLTSGPDQPTIDLPPQPRQPFTPLINPSAQTPPSSAPRSSSGPRFQTGDVLAGRYRIVGLLGKGGMGEVYRAEDLTLGASVALKFLPPLFASDPSRLQRFLNEVRVTRQVSHPNVCRVYDAVDIEGQLALAMEYIDGEDLASLLRRIGRLPADKATEIARHVCAGLASAHDLGIIHRDLKPSNIMLDGRGRARLTDFGLAGFEQAINAPGEAGAGTPTYMAPEQLAGRAVTQRSDIYSLGLVLFEIYTGQSYWAGKAKTIDDLRRHHQSATPHEHSSALADIDPVVDRLVQRCLRLDAAERPSSALIVAAGLPGADPLAAALAAGETPSPELVAASGRTGALTPRAATMWLAGLLLALTSFLLATSRSSILRFADPKLPPEALTLKAREALHTLKHTAPEADFAIGFVPSDAVLSFTEDSARRFNEARWWPVLSQLPTACFFLRTSPQRLEPSPVWMAEVTPDEPPMQYVGEARVLLDLSGKLLRYDAMPSSLVSSEQAAAPPAAPDWSPLLALSGLDAQTLTPTPPQSTPHTSADTRVAWNTQLPTDPPTPVRIEAASERGVITYFRIFAPWTPPDRATQNAPGSNIIGYLSTALVLIAMTASVVLSWRNLQARRCDLRGGTALGLFVFVVIFASHFLAPTRLDQMIHISLVQRPLARALWMGVFAFLFYSAVEPICRRLWPSILVSWARLTRGGIRDPLVGRDLLIGVVVGLAVASAIRWLLVLAPDIGIVPPEPSAIAWQSLVGVRAALSILCNYLAQAILFSMLAVLLLVGARRLTSSNKRAIILWGVLNMALTTGDLWSSVGTVIPVIALLLFSIFITVVDCLTMLKGGCLAVCVMSIVAGGIAQFPITTDLSAWYSGLGLLALGSVLLLAFYGWFTALAGQRLFPTSAPA